MLWIAFKFVSLYWLQQHSSIVLSATGCCELLSNLYLCTDCNNRGVYRSPWALVVNCFQICIFVLIATTFREMQQTLLLLWIAFKFVSLYWLQQRRYIWNTKGVSCELLSNLYLCTDCNNFVSRETQRDIVVNCFQICIFVLIATTLQFNRKEMKRCELLSNLYLCTDCNNRRATA